MRNQSHYLLHDTHQVDAFLLVFIRSHEVSDALDDLLGTVGVVGDVVQQVIHLRVIETVQLHSALGDLGLREDGGQRLAQLMTKRHGHGAKVALSVHVHDLSAKSSTFIVPLLDVSQQSGARRMFHYGSDKCNMAAHDGSDQADANQLRNPVGAQCGGLGHPGEYAELIHHQDCHDCVAGSNEPKCVCGPPDLGKLRGASENLEQHHDRKAMQCVGQLQTCHAVGRHQLD